MTPQFTGHHIEITPALRDFTEKKLARIKPHSDLITSLHITFNVNKLSQIAEAKMSVPGQTIHAKAEDENMYNAIDAMVGKLSRQLIKYKEKHTEHHHKKPMIDDDTE
jgi:putative sigma-54 modulation protein